MTACYAKDRRAALDKLGRRYDCVCHPEIMNAFVYGLNDTDERVRREAADEIGDQTRRNRCCCSPCVISALTCSLADCDRGVRREATQALRACGYEVVDGCCDGCGDNGCGDAGNGNNGCGSNGCGATPVSAPAAVQPQPTPSAPEAVPAPAPPADPQAFFPSRLHNNQSKKSSLAGLFGMVR
ncbi:MAG: HEAT repeat domain-containing protein [Planctomycetota bacterium]|nr:HEAT repeat domain-containing protein [Planctomycetales bacterium]RLT05398.1 MAG: HEAT repeat domain-containing protein [Planctomycetota bacterium]